MRSIAKRQAAPNIKIATIRKHYLVTLSTATISTKDRTVRSQLFIIKAYE